MGETCKDGSCSAGQYNSGNCGDCGGKYGNQCNKGNCCDTGCSMCNKMVWLADKAWEHAVMEKMKAHWESTMGEKIDEIAKASVETSMAYHMNMMKGKTEVGQAAKKIQEAMSG